MVPFALAKGARRISQDRQEAMARSSIYSEQRKQQISEILLETGSVNVNDLAERFGVTTATIRTDLTDLEKAGELVRTHGGAVPNANAVQELFLSERENEDKKQRVALRALDFIDEDDTILIDTGTSSYALARALARSNIEKLRVYTNDFVIAKQLESKEDFEVHLLGGRVRKGFHYSYGGTTIAELRRFNFDKLFLTASSVDAAAGLTTYHTETATLKIEMISASRQRILLVDSTKLNKVAFAKFADLREIDVLIIDSEVKKFEQDYLSKHIKQVVLAQDYNASRSS